MPRLRADRQLEAAPGRLPGLERRDLDVEPARSRERCHPRVELDAEHLAAASGEQRAGDAGAAGDVEHAARSIGEQRVDERRRVGGAGAVVQLGDLAEGLGSPAFFKEHRFIVG